MSSFGDDEFIVEGRRGYVQVADGSGSLTGSKLITADVRTGTVTVTDLVSGNLQTSNVTSNLLGGVDAIFSGNVGIGTTKWLANLHVNGSALITTAGLRIDETNLMGYSAITDYLHAPDFTLTAGLTTTGDVKSGGKIIALDADVSNTLWVSTISLSEVVAPIDGKPFLINTGSNLQINGGNVGIGTNNPVHELQVVGNVFATKRITGEDLSITSNLYFSNVRARVAAPFSLTTDTNVQIVGGNVGVGTTSPNYELHTEGNIYATQNIISLATITASNIRALGYNFNILGSNVGIGTTNALDELHVVGNVRATQTLTSANLDTTGTLTFSNLESRTNLPLTVTTDTNVQILGGNVGVGTTRPNYDLHTVGNIHASRTLTSTNLSVNGSLTFSNLVARTGAPLSLTTDTNVVIMGGNVGVGTVSPLDELHVVGNVRATQTLTSANLDTTGTLTFSNLESRSGVPLSLTTDTNVAVMGGNVGIGSTQPTHTLEVIGDTNVSLSLRTPTVYIDTIIPTSAATNYTLSGFGTNDFVSGGIANYSFGSLVPTKFFDVRGDVLSSGTISSTGSRITGTLTTSNVVNEAGNALKVVTDTNVQILGGNVGIGTTAPLKPLHVIGDGWVQGTLTVSNIIGASPVTISSDLTFPPTATLTVANFDGDETNFKANILMDDLRYIYAKTITHASTTTFTSNLRMSPDKTLSVSNLVGNSPLTISTDSNIILLTNKVGIGSTMPVNDFDVVGDASITGSVTTANISSTNVNVTYAVNSDRINTSNASITGTFFAQNADVSNLTVLADCFVQGNLQVAGDTFTISTATTVADKIAIENFGEGPGMRVLQGGLYPVAEFLDVSAGLTTTALFITGGEGGTVPARVGIRTTVPSCEFEVVGNACVTQSLTSSNLFTGGTVTFSNITNRQNVPFKFTTDSNIQFLGGEVGMGTTVPLSNLHVVNNIFASNAIVSPSAEIYDQMYISNIYGRTGAPIHLVTDQFYRILGGNVGIGTNTPKFEIHTEGNVYATKTLTSSNLDTTGTLTFSNVKARTSAPFRLTTDTNVQVTGGNVGIGTNIPKFELDVYGNVHSFLTMTSAYLDTYGTVTFSNVKSRTGSPYTLTTDTNVQMLGGNVGIGTTRPLFELHVTGNARASQTLTSTNLDTTGTLTFSNVRSRTSVPFSLTTDTNVTVMGGNVGVGTTRPLYELHTQGNVRASQTLTSTNLDTTGTLTFSNVKTRTNVPFSLTTDTTAAIMGGNVGIGTTVPLDELHVQGNIRASQTLTSSNLDITGTLSFSNIDARTGVPFSLTTDTNVTVMGGNVGIGTTRPLDELHVHGNIRASQTLTSTNLDTTGTLTFSNVKARAGVPFSLTTDSNVTVMGGNVGLGTTRPNYTLDVFENINANLFMTTPTLYNDLYRPRGINYTLSGYGATQFLSDGVANYGFGTLVPTKFFEVDGDMLSTGTITCTDTDVTQTLTHSNVLARPGVPYSLTTNTNVQIMGGNVGIGTFSPNFELHVFGNVRATRTLTSTNLDTTGTLTFSNVIARTGVPFSLTTDTNVTIMGSNVGIGTTTPGYELNVIGNVYATKDISSTETMSTTNIFLGGTVTSSNIIPKDTEVLRINSNVHSVFETGNVAIGNIVPVTKLHVDGKGTFSNVTQLNPVIFKISLQNTNTLNNAIVYTVNDLFDLTLGAVLLENTGVYTFTNNSITVPSLGYYRITVMLNYSVNSASTVSLGVREEVEGVLQTFKNVLTFNNLGTAYYTNYYNFVNNRTISFFFARESTANTTVNLDGPASYILIEKI